MYAPTLEGDALAAVRRRGSHLQIIAAAGAGKTEAERPFELHLDGVTVSGFADVILDQEGGVPTGLAILDYQTSTTLDEDQGLQLQVYTDAGRRKGLDVRGAYVHDLKAGARLDIDVTTEAVSVAEVTILSAADRLRARDYAPESAGAVPAV